MKLGRESFGKRIQHKRGAQDTSFDNCKISPPTLSFSPYQVSRAMRARNNYTYIHTYVHVYVQTYAVFKAILQRLYYSSSTIYVRLTQAHSDGRSVFFKG